MGKYRFERTEATPIPDNAQQKTQAGRWKNMFVRVRALSVPVYTAANFFFSIFLLRLFVWERGRGRRKFYPPKEKESSVFEFRRKWEFWPQRLEREFWPLRGFFNRSIRLKHLASQVIDQPNAIRPACRQSVYMPRMHISHFRLPRPNLERRSVVKCYNRRIDAKDRAGRPSAPRQGHISVFSAIPMILKVIVTRKSRLTFGVATCSRSISISGLTCQCTPKLSILAELCLSVHP